MPTPVLPDPVVVARTALLGQATLTAVVNQRVYQAIPSDPAPTYPLLVVSLVDDDEERPEAMIARVQVDVWGKGKSIVDLNECRMVANIVRSVARDMRGAWSGTWGSASITLCAPGQIIPNPDETSGRARFICDLEIHTQ
jgi:hypothetical protein